MSSESPYELVLQRLDSRNLLVSDNEGTASALCPAHNDTRPSLSVSDGGDKALIYCHSGCPIEDVVEAVDLGLADLFVGGTDRRSGQSQTATRKPRTGKPAEYVYRNADDEPVLRIVRSPSKRFHAEHWTGEVWEKGKGPKQPPLYNLSCVWLAKATGRPILVVEGEKDADRATGEGFPATTNPFGAGRWSSVDITPLDGLDVVVVADNDDPGRRHADEVVTSLIGRASRLRSLDLSELVPEKGDISDWFDSGGTKDQLSALVDALPEIHQTPNAQKRVSRFGTACPIVFAGNLELYRADDLLDWADEPITWRVRGLLVHGTYAVVGGSKKTLKTTLFSAELAFAVANGTTWLGAPGFEVEAPCPVVVLINEGTKPYIRSLRRISARYAQNGVGPVHVVEAQGAKFGDPDLEDILRRTVEEVGVGLFIFDATYGFIKGDTEAANVFAMGEQLGWIQKICSELDVDLVVVHHLKKNQRGGKTDLDDIAWAGFPEWADTWFLLKHASPPDVANGHFRVGLVAGSRQGYEFLYEVSGDTGGFNPVTLEPRRAPAWRVSTATPEDAERWGTKRISKSPGPEGILSLVDSNPFQYTKSQIAEMLPGSDKNHTKEIDRMISNGSLEQRHLKRQEKGISRERFLIGRPGQDPPKLIINISLPKE